jgi:hypothetical protein
MIFRQGGNVVVVKAAAAVAVDIAAEVVTVEVDAVDALVDFVADNMNILFPECIFGIHNNNRCIEFDLVDSVVV